MLSDILNLSANYKETIYQKIKKKYRFYSVKSSLNEYSPTMRGFFLLKNECNACHSLFK